jgi:hypothetical protein
VRAILNKKAADVNHLDELIACYSNSEKIITLLIGEGADPNVSRPVSFSPLSVACETKDDSRGLVTVSALIAAKADINQRNESELTPLYIACVAGNARIVSFLVSAGASIAEDVHSPLFFACQCDDDKKGVSTVEALLAANADVNWRDKEGDTALVVACQVRNVITVTTMLAAGASTEASKGHSPLFVVCEGNDDEKGLALLSALITAKADVEGLYETGFSPLIVACNARNANFLPLLTAAGADPNEH